MQSHTYTSQFTTNFEICKAKSPKTHNISVVYIHGLYSTPYGRKPEAARIFCEENNIDFIRFELIGHCSDINNYEKADVVIWLNQVLEFIDAHTDGNLLLIGHSLGGWLSILTALKLPHRIKSLLLTAPGVDFIKDLRSIFTDEQKQEMEQKGKIEYPTSDFTYIFTKALITNGEELLLLDKDTIPLDIPVHIIQGKKDRSLDWHKALEIADKLESKDVILKIIKDGNHRLFSDQDIQEILDSLKSLTAQFKI